MFANDFLLNYKLYAANNFNCNNLIKSDMDNYMKQLLQLKAEHSFLQNNLNLFNEMIEQLRNNNNESIAEILENLMKQLTNFNKRIITIEDGFFKTAKMVMWYEQAKDIFNRNVTNLFTAATTVSNNSSTSSTSSTTTSTPTPSTINQQFQFHNNTNNNLFNDFLNIESITTPEIISEQLKKLFSNDQISLDVFSNLVAKCSTKYLIETINCPKNWYELPIRARNMFKDIFVWLKINNIQNTNINNSNGSHRIYNNVHYNINNNSSNNINNDLNPCSNSTLIKTTSNGSINKLNNNNNVIDINNNSNNVLNLEKPPTQRSRTKKRLNKKQYEELVNFYTLVSFYPKSKQLNELGKKLNLSLKFIQNWFANRRRRDNFDRTVSKRKIVNCKLNKVQKDALNALFLKNPYANKDEMRELADTYNLDYGAVSRWLNIKRSTNERLLSNKANTDNINNINHNSDESLIDDKNILNNNHVNNINSTDDAVDDEDEFVNVNYNIDVDDDDDDDIIDDDIIDDDIIDDEDNNSIVNNNNKNNNNNNNNNIQRISHHHNHHNVSNDEYSDN